MPTQSTNNNKTQQLQLTIQKNIITNDDYDEMKFNDLKDTDNRSFLQHYWAVLRKMQPIIFIFFIKSIKILSTTKILMFFVRIAMDFGINAMFYSDKYISMNFNQKNSWYIDLLVSGFTILASAMINVGLAFLVESEKKLGKIRKKVIKNLKRHARKFIKRFKIGIIVFHVVTIILEVGLCYYMMAFCAVYRKSQMLWFLSGVKSFVISQAISFIIALGFTIVLYIAVTTKSNWIFKLYFIGRRFS